MASGSWDNAKSEFYRSADPDALLAWRTGEVDRVVREAHAELLGNQDVALLAVGGYGRRQLFPYSDVDLLLLFDSEKAAQHSKKILAPFLQRLWDSGLRLSHSVRTVAECTELHDRNIELNVSLIDLRPLVGSPDLAAKLSERLPRFIHGQRDSLIRHLARLTRERHSKYGDTIHHLEPNVKEGPGGLRDLQLLWWISQIRHADPRRIVPPEPFPDLDAARRFLFALRCYLHFQSGRDANALTFDTQEWVAEIAARQDPAAWMREFFRHAQGIYRAATRQLDAAEAHVSSLFSQFRDWRSRLSNAEFTVLRERVYFRVPQQLAEEPPLALRLFDFVARHGIRLSQDAEQRLADRHTALVEHFAQGNAQPVWPALRGILAQPHVDLALRGMNETGFLRVLFPEMEEIECLVIRDFYHRYTVDEHTLMTIQHIVDLRGNKQSTFSDLLAELEQPALLAFALLFHDAGKASPDEGHVDGSLRLAGHAMERIGMPEADRDLVRFLIARHLDLSQTMNTRDLDDAATIASLAARVGSVERLKALTLLTYADISAVHPHALTPWRASQLFRLYLLTYNALTRELDTNRITARSADSPELAAFLEGFPTRYLRTNTEREIQAHFALRKEMEASGVAVDLARIEGGYRLTLLTTDRPFLFASIAGTLSAFGMNILKAEAFANRRGEVLDTFCFADPLRTLDLNPSEQERLVSTLERVVLGNTDVRQLLKDRPKATPPSRGARFDPRVSFDSAQSETATLIQIVAEDRPGLLYDLALAMSSAGCNIEVVLIDTEAHKAIDVFYVTSAGRKLTQEQQENLHNQLVIACRG